VLVFNSVKSIVQVQLSANQSICDLLSLMVISFYCEKYR